MTHFMINWVQKQMVQIKKNNKKTTIFKAASVSRNIINIKERFCVHKQMEAVSYVNWFYSARYENYKQIRKSYALLLIKSRCNLTDYNIQTLHMAL